MMNTIGYQKQNGIALFMAMIALLMISVMAASLVRSVDNNNSVTTNINFRQIAVSSGDGEIWSSTNWIGDHPDLMMDDFPLAGYYATYNNLDFTDPTLWEDGKSNSWNDDNGNERRVVIERMCTNKLNVPAGDDGTPKNTTCLFGAQLSDQDSVLVKSSTEASGNTSSGNSPLYRITVRIKGNKGITSYMQAFVY